MKSIHFIVPEIGDVKESFIVDEPRPRLEVQWKSPNGKKFSGNCYSSSRDPDQQELKDLKSEAFTELLSDVVHEVFDDLKNGLIDF
ncbi:hypothetical protein KKA14_04745 [bacterium]|nr:hypothetical protein [bacterium]